MFFGLYSREVNMWVWFVLACLLSLHLVGFSGAHGVLQVGPALYVLAAEPAAAAAAAAHSKLPA